jgi:hypothetical protein
MSLGPLKYEDDGLEKTHIDFERKRQKERKHRKWGRRCFASAHVDFIIRLWKQNIFVGRRSKIESEELGRFNIKLVPFH